MRRLVLLGTLALALFTVGCGGDDANVDRTVTVPSTAGMGGQPIPVITGVAIGPANPTITVGQSLQLAASTSFGPEPGATWTSSNSQIASITSSGLVTGLSPGTVTVTVTASGGSLGSTNVTVSPVAVTSLAITPNPVQLAVNTRVQLAATTTLANGQQQEVTTQVGWTTANGSVAQVSATGELVAVGPGTTTVTATQPGGQTATATVTVTNVGLQNITFAPAISNFRVGNSIQITATGTFTDGSQQDITQSASWFSSNPGVATVTNTVPKGQVVGISPGVATIQASIGEVGSSFQVNVSP